MKYYLFMLLLTFIGSGYAQTKISGQVIDAESKTGIPYVNIGITTKAIGTVSDAEGNYILEGVELEDTISISSIGYKTIKHTAKGISEMGWIELEAKDYDLNVVEVKATRFDGDDKIFGVRNKTRGLSIGFGNAQLGTEIGSPIKIDKTTYIKNVNFVLNHAKGDSLLLRVNIYDFKDGVIGENVLAENILIQEEQRKGTFSIDLSNQNIVLQSDVLLSLEWIRDFDKLGNKGITFDTKKAKKPRGIYIKPSSNAPFKLITVNQSKNVCFYFVGKELK